MRVNFLMIFAAALLLFHGTRIGAQNAPAAIPAPHFQGDFFGEMPRVFCTFVRIDTQSADCHVVKRDSDGKIVRFPSVTIPEFTSATRGAN